jgi:predicted transcriptional regulator
VFDVPIETLSGSAEQRLEAQLREALSDPLLTGKTDIPPHELELLAAQPAAARAILALHQAARAARHDADRLQLPGERHFILPREEVRRVFEQRHNYFEELEEKADSIRQALAAGIGLAQGEELPPSETNHAVATRLRQHHGIVVRITALDGALRMYDASARLLLVSDLMPRERRGFLLAFQLMLIEAGDLIEALLNEIGPSSTEARTALHIGLGNYAAACVLMPYGPFLKMALATRYDVDNLAVRFGVSFHQAAHRLSTLQRPGARGIPMFFARVDPAGNISKSFSACDFPILRQGNPCPKWTGCTAFSTPGLWRVETAQFSDGRVFLTFARTVEGPRTALGDQPPVHAIAMGCPIEHATETVYADRVNLSARPTPIGLSCYLCDWTECRSRAFPSLYHRLPAGSNPRAMTLTVSTGEDL